MARASSICVASGPAAERALLLPYRVAVRPGRRARLLAASAISGGTLRNLAVAAGVAATLGAAPAFAGCNSGSVPNTSLLSDAAC